MKTFRLGKYIALKQLGIWSYVNTAHNCNIYVWKKATFLM